MSWEQFREDAKRFVNRAASKINQTADIAGLQLKLSAAEHRLSTAYEALGEAAYLHFSTENADTTPIVKAADKLSAHIKCLEEQKAGNTDFDTAARQTWEAMKAAQMPELDWFLDHCLAPFALNLDQL
jgi:5'-deoxynucleotidase YfbR-like HD superfamily hydrolase